jgi:glycine cleavage system H protein
MSNQKIPKSAQMSFFRLEKRNLKQASLKCHLLNNVIIENQNKKGKVMTIYYSEDHEWINVEGNTGTVGITNYAQNALGDIVFVEVPGVGDDFAKGDEVAVVESVKAASEIYSPVTGEVSAVNEFLEDNAALVNTSPDGDGWFFKISIADESELEGLLDEAGYNAFIAGLE